MEVGAWITRSLASRSEFGFSLAMTSTTNTTDSFWVAGMEEFSLRAPKDHFGFPTDQSILEFLTSNYEGKNANCFLVSPSGTGKTTAFSRLDGAFIDEETIMKLKWNMGTQAFSDKKAKDLWLDICTNVLGMAVVIGLPVAMSVTMYKRTKDMYRSVVRFRVRMLVSDRQMRSNLKARARERDSSFEYLVNKAKTEVEYIMGESFHYDLHDPYYLDDKCVMSDPDMIRCAHFLREMGLMVKSPRSRLLPRIDKYLNYAWDPAKTLPKTAVFEQHIRQFMYGVGTIAPSDNRPLDELEREVIRQNCIKVMDKFRGREESLKGIKTMFQYPVDVSSDESEADYEHGETYPDNFGYYDSEDDAYDLGDFREHDGPDY